MKIIVCGAGTMGSGIAQAAAVAGFHTCQYDLTASMLDRSQANIEDSLAYLVKKGKLSAEEKEEITRRLHLTTDLKDCIGDVIIEAIVEKYEAKIELFCRLSEINSPKTIFASNTSSLSITRMQEGIPYPDRVAGMHFFNPAHIMKLVELVRGKHTAPATVKLMADIATKMGKVPVYCEDAPGFIVNRVARTYYLEAMHLAEKHHIRVESIDRIMEASGFKMGPFRLMDLIGLDINYEVSRQVWQALGKPDRLKPAVWQQQKVAAGQLGRKTGEGFYTYKNIL